MLVGDAVRGGHIAPTVGSSSPIFHASKVPVRTWVLIVFQMASSKNGMAAREVQRLYGLPPKTALVRLPPHP
jgi:hypothetical protein